MATDDFPTPPGARRRVLVPVAAVCVIAAALAWWSPWTGSPRHPLASPGAAPTQPTAPARPSQAQPEDGGGGNGAGPVVDDLPAGRAVVTLPRGRRVVSGWRVGYPRTTTGAVAAAVEYVSHAGCLTRQCVEATLRAGVDPGWTQARSRYTAGMLTNRADIGLPRDVPVPAGAQNTITPLAFQIDTTPRADAAGAPTADVRVVMLCYLAMAGPGIRPTTRSIVMPVPLRWDGTDFKMVPGDRPYPELVARPGTPAAIALGWRDFAA